jgi:sensor histidine kinase regulating citrate/malate metabolism
MSKKSSRLSIGFKFALIASALVLTALGLLSLVVSMTMTRYLDDQAMAELTSTVKQNSDNARQANELAQRASQVAAVSGEMVSQVVTTMSGIQA